MIIRMASVSVRTTTKDPLPYVYYVAQSHETYKRILKHYLAPKQCKPPQPTSQLEQVLNVRR